MSKYDHYAEAKWIADQIEVAGLSAEAVAVRDAIDDGVSGTEIVMKLRHHLAPICDDHRIDAAVRERLRILIERIDDALSR